MVSPSLAMKPTCENDESSFQISGASRSRETSSVADEENEEESARAKRQRRLDLSSEVTLDEPGETGGRETGGESKEASFSPTSINLTEAAVTSHASQASADDQAAALSQLIREHGRNQVQNNNGSNSNPAVTQTQLVMAQLELQRLQQQQQQSRSTVVNNPVNVQQLLMNAHLMQQQQQQQHINLLAALGRAQAPNSQQPMFGLATIQQMMQQQNHYNNLLALAAHRGGPNAASGSFGSPVLGGAGMRAGLPGLQQPGMTAATQASLANFLPPANLNSINQNLGAAMGLTAGNHSQGSSLPAMLAQPDDNLKLSSQQVFLRHQIEAFRACEDDIMTHTRGRNKPVAIGQVGIRCRYCSHLQVARRQKGSTYFPASLNGLYQAAQNMNTSHMSSGICTEMPLAVKQEFARLNATKEQASAAGRPYWANAAAALGLVDTEDGIRHINDVRPKPTALGGE